MITRAENTSHAVIPATYKLRGLNGPFRKQTLPLERTYSAITVGSDRDCNISLGNLRFFKTPEEQNHVASIHGGFFFVNQNDSIRVEYMDFGAKQILGEGYISEINGETLKTGKKYPLKIGDTIKLGDLVFKFERAGNRLYTFLSRAITSVKKTAKLLRQAAAGLLLP